MKYDEVKRIVESSGYEVKYHWETRYDEINNGDEFPYGFLLITNLAILEIRYGFVSMDIFLIQRDEKDNFYKESVLKGPINKLDSSIAMIKLRELKEKLLLAIQTLQSLQRNKK